MLSVEDLKVYFFSDERIARAVDGISYEVRKGETVCLVGESGCGKTVSALTIMRILPMPPGRIMGGRILFQGQNLLDLDDEEMQKVRGKQMAMIFQEPMTSLNPVFTVEDQIGEAITVHEDIGQEELRRRCIQLLRDVGIPSPEERLKDYPHQLSGGQRQRVMIAMALACNPDLVIADEPTTALDVTIQAQILDLMRNLHQNLGTSIILITHDLGVVAEMCQRVAVMYAGEIVEETDVTTLFKEPLHPYTRGLIGSIPVLGEIKDQLDVIPGNVPNLIDLPLGCRFAPRCRARVEHELAICTRENPDLKPATAHHTVRCWLYQ